MTNPRILVVAHNHPAFHPGGTEIVAHDLFQAYKRAGWDALFLAATNQVHREARPGTSFQAVGDAADEIVLWAGHFDRFALSQIDLHGVVPDLVALLEEFRPDVVEIHHLLLVGAEFPALVRRVLPNARIVFMLHDYYPICANEGLMIRTRDHSRCLEASPDRCHACFPEMSAANFRLREINIKSHLAAVDTFISPSHFLKDRYVDWGIPADRIAVIENGHPVEDPVPHRGPPHVTRNVFGYFGNLNPWKGVNVLLDACRELAASDVDFELRMHGAALFQSDGFTADLEAKFADVRDNVRRLGQYSRSDVPDLMSAVDWVIVPSVWWENAPLTIGEARFHGRPIIASGIGGMAELVDDERNGIHALPGDAHDLA
ncbi:MAG TPA: glycosyltransferase family 4 protein, partial [Pseudolabrys sp.]|nr:glycosyltransferase family 4 protein [Pseudolabrys sp.]